MSAERVGWAQGMIPAAVHTAVDPGEQAGHRYDTKIKLLSEIPLCWLVLVFGNSSSVPPSFLCVVCGVYSVVCV